MYNRIATFLTIACVASTQLLSAGSSPTVPPLYLVSPAVQDLSGPIYINKTIYQDFTPIHTTTTLQLAQDFRGRLTGTAKFASTISGDNRTFNVTGKLKIKRNNVDGSNLGLRTLTFSVKGSSTGNTSITLNGILTHYEYPLPPAEGLTRTVAAATLTSTSTELQSTSVFLVDERITGASRKYTFQQETTSTAAGYLYYEPAPDDITLGLPKKKNSEYYLLTTPWGTGLALGTLRTDIVPATFTLKASKFTCTLTDTDFAGTFDPETYQLHLSYGQFTGAVIPPPAP